MESCNRLRFVAGALVLVGALGAARPIVEPPTRVLIVGGGPNPEYNQVAIENNVRWVDTLVPGKLSRTVLYCDGKGEGPLVQVSEEQDNAADALSLLFQAPRTSGRSRSGISYRSSAVSKIDGPSTLQGISSRFDQLSLENSPVLLYFTGHGSPDRRNLDANRFDLWGEGGITPEGLSKQISRLPPGTPVTLVMVQCFSGAFANLIFQNGDPQAPLVDRPVCGGAAGCTPELDEAEYRDFTSSFFAGLTGRDRVGRKVARPDYNQDGKIGFDEAYAYALVNDPSIDVPVVTSDAFLRRFVPVEDDTVITEIPWEKIRQAASPAQRAALDGLCVVLGPRAQGADRVANALDEFRRRSRQGDARPRFTDKIRTETAELRDLIGGIHPGIQRPPARQGESDAEYEASGNKAVAWLESHPETRKRLDNLSAEVDKVSRVALDDSVAGARWLRLLRLSKSIVLELRLRQAGDKSLIARYEALRRMESANPLWP